MAHGQNVHGTDAPALEQVGHVPRDLLSHHHVQPVVGLDARGATRQQRLLAAHDHAEQRVAGKPQRTNQLSHDRVVGADRIFHDLSAEATDRAGLHERARKGGLAGGNAEPLASHSTVPP